MANQSRLVEKRKLESLEKIGNASKHVITIMNIYHVINIRRM